MVTQMAQWGAVLGRTISSTIGGIVNALKGLILPTIALLIIGWFGAPFWLHANPATVQVKNLIFAGLQNVDELTTVTVDAKATVRVEKPREVFNIQVGQTNFVYEGVSKVQAGINLNQLRVESVSSDRRSVRIILPAPYIRDIGLDVGHSSILANYSEWFAAKATPELQEEAQLKAIAAIRQEACQQNILEAANNSTKQLLTNVLTKLGYTTIDIETQLPTESCASSKSV